MKEFEWLISEDVHLLIRQVHFSQNRKKWLYTVACFRQNYSHLEPIDYILLAALERFADQTETDDDQIFYNYPNMETNIVPPLERIMESNYFISFIKRAHAAVVKEIWPNPIKKVIFDPVWRTSTVLGIAKTIYEERNPNGTFQNDIFEVLADALEDAGCTDNQILDHCHSRIQKVTCPKCKGKGTDPFSYYDTKTKQTIRGTMNCTNHIIFHKNNTKYCINGEIDLPDPIPHYRGCWLIDMILEK